MSSFSSSPSEAILAHRYASADRQERGVDEATAEKRLLKVKTHLDDLLGKYNPGETLSWWVSETAFKVPRHTFDQLTLIGPALHDFFRVANLLLQRHAWIGKRLEKDFSPYYRLLNQSQLDAQPRLLRPDVVCDHNWNAKLVELEITVGARADTAIMSRYYDIAQEHSLLRSYASMAKDYERQGKNIALVTSPHPFFVDLPDDAKAFASLLREAGANNIIVLTDENLASLRFDGKSLTVHERFSPPKTIHVIDRFIDIYEIAELQHPGMGAILDAYLAGAITDVNTCKQNIDEKDWMALFWEPKLRQEWVDLLGDTHEGILRQHIPKTWHISTDLRIELADDQSLPITSIGKLPGELRRFVIKESGTSTTASGAQSFYTLHTMNQQSIDSLLDRIFTSKVDYVIQELIESPRISFTAIDPDSLEIKRQNDARVKLSPFYIDGILTDTRFIASNKKYAVNDEDCVVGVVAKKHFLDLE